jgi:hypothetical protein
MKDVIRTQDGEPCMHSDKHGPHVPAQAMIVGYDNDGNRLIACVPACPKPADGPAETNGETR